MVAGGCAWLRGGVHGCRGHAWLWGACVVAGGCAWLPGGHVWLGGHSWLPGRCAWLWGCMVVGGMHGCRGVCMVVGGACVGYDKIRSMSGRCASYWNAFLFILWSLHWIITPPTTLDYLLGRIKAGCYWKWICLTSFLEIKLLTDKGFSIEIKNLTCLEEQTNDI